MKFDITTGQNMKTTTFIPETILNPNPQVISRTLEGETVLLLPEQGKVRVINEVGAAIWELLDGQRSIRQVAAAISEHFDVDLHTAEADTLNFIAELAERGLVQPKR